MDELRPVDHAEEDGFHSHERDHRLGRGVADRVSGDLDRQFALGQLGGPIDERPSSLVVDREYWMIQRRHVALFDDHRLNSICAARTTGAFFHEGQAPQRPGTAAIDMLEIET